MFLVYSVVCYILYSAQYTVQLLFKSVQFYKVYQMYRKLKVKPQSCLMLL